MFFLISAVICFNFGMPELISKVFSAKPGILRSPDEAYQQKRAARIRKVRGRDVPTKNTQLHLIHGPPGTGKTMAVKVLAAEAGLVEIVDGNDAAMIS